MRPNIFVMLALVGLPLQAAEFSPPLSPPEPLPAIAADLIHIPASEATILPMAEWDVIQRAAGEQTGERVLIREGADAVASAPPEASRYEARVHKYPSGAVRILKWDRNSGPVVHQVTFETELFVVQGEADVVVDGRAVRLRAGDAAFLPSGVLRNMNPTDDTVVVQYFVGHTAEAPKAQVVRGSELTAATIVQWEEDGDYLTARTDAERQSAPSHAATYLVKRYAFDGNSIRHAELLQGGNTNPGTYQVDVLIYIVEGRMRRTEGDQTFEVSAGDTVRERKGATGYWEILEDSVFIATDAPLDPAKPVPSP